jgi:hypothetical protein
MTPEHPREEQEPRVDSSQTSALAPLKSLAGAAGVLTGIAFIDGWLYWATYYTAFGLNSLMLDLPFSVVSVSPVQVLVRDWNTESYQVKGLLVLAVIAGIALSVLFVRLYKRGHAGATVLLLVLALGMSAGAWWLGFHDARLDSGCSSRLATITFELIKPPDNADVPPPCLRDSGQTCLLVLHVNNAYRYFVAPDQGFCGAASTALGAGRMTYEMPDSQIQIANIQTHIGW